MSTSAPILPPFDDYRIGADERRIADDSV